MTHTIDAISKTSQGICEEFLFGSVGALWVRDNGTATSGRKELQPPGNVRTGLLIQSEMMV